MASGCRSIPAGGLGAEVAFVRYTRATPKRRLTTRVLALPRRGALTSAPLRQGHKGLLPAVTLAALSLHVRPGLT